MKKIISLILVFALLLSLGACSSGSKKVSFENAVIWGKVDENGSVYIPLMDGESISIRGDIREACITADREHLLVLELDGLLYVTSPKNLEEKTVIADDADTISIVRSTGIIFKDFDSKAYRYTFADSETVSLGDNVAFIASNDALNLLLADDQGDIFILPEGTDETEKISTYEDSIELEAISNDCTTAAWAEKDSTAGIYTVYVYNDGSRQKVDEVEYNYNYANIQFNKTGTFMTVSNIYSQNVFFSTVENMDLIRAKMGDELTSSTVYTANGTVANDTAEEITGLYVLVDSDEGSNMYYIDMDGGREKMAMDIDSFEIAGNRVYYLNSDDELYTAQLDGYTLVEETRIAGDVSAYKISYDGEYVYYTRNVDDNVGSLYRFHVSAEEPEKISSNVYSYQSDYFTLSYFYLSTDGKTVYYFEDVEEEIADTYTDCGTLKSSTEGSDPVKISTDAIVTSPASGLREGYVNPNGFAFSKYISSDADGNLLVNWMYWNGSEADTFAREVYYSYTPVREVASDDAPATDAPAV